MLIENSIKNSTQKQIILQTGLIKLCTTGFIHKSDDITNNKDLETRVTNIENFLKAGNFAKTKGEKFEKNNNTSSKKEPVVTKKIVSGKTQDYWPKIVEEFKKNGKMLMYMNLEGSIAREVNDMTIEIDFPNGINSMAKDFLTKPDIKQDLKEKVHLACGKEMQIKIGEKKQENNFQQDEFEKFIGDKQLPFNII